MQASVGRGHGTPASSEDRGAPRVVPVVQDALEEVSVGTGGNGREEIARSELAAIIDTGIREMRARRSNGVGQVEEDSAHVRMRGEDRRNEMTVAAADIDDAGRAGEIDFGRDRLRDRSRQVAHRTSEGGSCARILLEVAKVVAVARAAASAQSRA